MPAEGFEIMHRETHLGGMLQVCGQPVRHISMHGLQYRLRKGRRRRLRALPGRPLLPGRRKPLRGLQDVQHRPHRVHNMQGGQEAGGQPEHGEGDVREVRGGRVLSGGQQRDAVCDVRRGRDVVPDMQGRGETCWRGVRGMPAGIVLRRRERWARGGALRGMWGRQHDVCAMQCGVQDLGQSWRRRRVRCVRGRMLPAWNDSARDCGVPHVLGGAELVCVVRCRVPDVPEHDVRGVRCRVEALPGWEQRLCMPGTDA